MAAKIKKIYYHKLIRDKIPQVMEGNKARYKIRRLDQKKLKLELLKKVGEEASGLLMSKTKAEITDELGDILAVINEIKRVFKITDKEISLAMKKAFDLIRKAVSGKNFILSGPKTLVIGPMSAGTPRNNRRVSYNGYYVRFPT